MKKFIQKAVLPFVILSTGILLSGCEQASEPQSDDIRTTQSADVALNQPTEMTATADLKSGNMFYMVRDIADMQLKAGDYVAQLKQTQNELQTAINDKDQQQLQATAKTLQQQLTGFNQALTSLNLKSQEIDSIRQNILHANQQVLATPFLNGNIDLNQLDFKKIEQQMGSIQTEMIKLAGMMIPQEQNKQDQES
jgi:hypothetical protein